jgi:hypothetical protein
MFKIGDKVKFIDNFMGRVNVGDKATIVKNSLYNFDIVYLKIDNSIYGILSCNIKRIVKIEEYKTKSHPLTKLFK